MHRLYDAEDKYMRKLQEKYPNRGKEQYFAFLNQYEFEVFSTLTLRDDTIPFERINRKIMNWGRNFAKAECIQIAFCGMVTRHHSQGRNHAHLLMLGRNRDDKTLLDCKLRALKSSWGAHAVIRPLYTRLDQEKAIEYIVCKNMGSYSEAVGPYNSKLLESTVLW